MVLLELSHAFVVPQEQYNAALLAELFQEIKTASLHHMLFSSHLAVYKVEQKTNYHHHYKNKKRDLTSNYAIFGTFEVHFAKPKDKITESLFIVQYQPEMGVRAGLIQSRMHWKNQMAFSLHIPAVLNNIPRYLGPFLDQASNFKDWPKRFQELLEEDRTERHLAMAMASHSRLKPLFLDEALFCSGIYQQFIAPMLDKEFEALN